MKGDIATEHRRVGGVLEKRRTVRLIQYIHNNVVIRHSQSNNL